MAEKPIKFLLNNQVQTLVNLDPNTTVLNYLRDHLHRCGTKEGCASGDCGACTVVVGEPGNDRIHYKAVNACITLLPSLHGKQLLTVEDLKQGQYLHPVQQAMVDNHASQCGFCTPGFVMSLYALWKNCPHPTRVQAQQALSGNLCRCTGYRAIIDAATSMGEAGDQGGRDEADTDANAACKQLQAMHDGKTPGLNHDGKHFFAPTDIQDLASLYLKYPKARLLAGGTDLALEITQQHRALDTIIYLADVPELRTINTAGDPITLGAAVTYSQCIEPLRQVFAELGQMLERLGSRQIRNQGTIGGNIGNASPIGDMSPVLLALDATLVLRRGLSMRRLKLENFFLDYKATDLRQAEFIERIEIPQPRPDSQLKIHKVSKRIDDDISAVLGAFNITLEGSRVTRVAVAFGGLAATPKRALHCESALRDQPWTQASVEAAMAALEQDFTPLSDVRASAGYRMQVAKNLVLKCFLEMQNPTATTRVTDYA